MAPADPKAEEEAQSVDAGLIPDLTDEEVLSANTIFDVVGPVCESADFLGKNRKLRRPISVI